MTTQPKINNMKTIVFVIFALLGITFSSYGQSDESSTSEPYEFMTLVCQFNGKQIDYIFITPPNGEYEKINIDGLKFENLETKPIIELLNKYSKEGWVLQSSNMAIDNANYNFYYLLKRKIKKQ
jgi:hypothetical protein